MRMMRRSWRTLLTTTSDQTPEDAIVEAKRQRIERLLQATAHEYDLRFEFGDWDVLGDGQLVLHMSPEAVRSAEVPYLKGQAFHLLGHYLSGDAEWVERARAAEAQGQPHFTRLWHALEDARIENQLIQRWPGMAKNLDAKLPPRLGGALVKMASRTRQIELGLYLEGRGLHGAQYGERVAELLAHVSSVIQQGANGPTPKASFEASLAIYPVMAPHLRGQMESDPPQRARELTPETAGKDQTTDIKYDEGRQPQIHTDDDLVTVGALGERRPFPDWYKPGSAPWFEQGFGSKRVHPMAVQTDRETIIVPDYGTAADYFELAKEVQIEAGFLAQRLKQLIREALYARYGGRYRSGKLDMARLWKQRTGSFRLFQRRIEQDRRDIAFSLLIDESASMKAGEKFHMASKTALMIGGALGELGVPLEIIGYSTQSYEAQAAMALGLHPPHEYRTMRCSRLQHRIYKRFDESFETIARRLTQIKPRHNNWDEEHLQFAFRRLQSQRSARKVMIVISDGQPNGDADHLIETVREISRLGGEIIGVGIGAEFVRNIYPQAIVVSDFQSLAEALVEMIAGVYRAPRALAA